MHSLGMLLKSYGPDVEHAERLVASFTQYNVDGLPLFVVVPDEDLPRFAGARGRRRHRPIGEPRSAQHLVDEPVAGIRPGYINQEIVKLAFWELGLAENYFCVDSDAVFVRPFGRDDFMLDETTPYTVLVEDNELKVEPRYYEEHWKGREIHLRRIQELVGLDDRRLLTCHGHQVFSGTVLRSLKDGLPGARGWTYADLLAEAPYEFTWYNFWLQKSQVIPIAVREPLVKTFHHEGQHLEYALRGIGPDDIARGFVGVVVNSNYAAPGPTATRAEAPEETLARYVQYPVLAKALALKVRATARRQTASGSDGARRAGHEAADWAGLSVVERYQSSVGGTKAEAARAPAARHPPALPDPARALGRRRAVWPSCCSACSSARGPAPGPSIRSWRSTGRPLSSPCCGWACWPCAAPTTSE